MRRAAAPFARAALFLLPLLAAPVLPAAAQPITERILAGAVIAEEADCGHLTVRFNLPVRYLSHFPYDTGQELCIRVRPLAFGANEKTFRFQRESLRPPDSERAAIARIEFDGDAVAGACLNINFQRPAYYSIAQGSDYRSINVAIAGAEPRASCKPRDGDGPPPPAAPDGKP
jgi:hypothetical protein